MKLLKQRYHLEKIIGQGAMGRVFLARDIQTQQEIAIKEHFVKKGPNQEMYIKRIQREFHFLQKIDHPYVVKAFELFYEHNRYFIVMEYIPGITLEHLLQKEYQSLSVEEQLMIAIKICETTSEINQTGIVHRDIKPANVILHHETYEPYIIDLGIAKQVNDELSSLTRSGDIVGTPDYLSPEAVVGETYPSSDVFSVGTILYQFFSWQQHSPFFAGSMVSTIDKIVNKNLLPLHEAYPNSDPMFHKVSLVLCKSLQKDHLRRISSLAEFASLLRKCRTQEEIVPKNTTVVWWGAVALIFVIIIAAAMLFSPNAEQLLATYQKKAEVYTAQKKYNLAIDYYSKVLEISNKAQVYFQRGQVYQSLTKFNEALADFDRALQKNRQMPEVYFHRAQVYYQQKKYDFAVNDLNLATRYNQKFFDAYWMRASIYEQQQKYKLAMDEYTTIIEFQPQNAAAYKERGLLHLKQEHYNYAIADLKACIEKDPQYKQILSLEIAKAKDKAKAQKNPRANLELATNYVTQGIQYEKTRQYELAINSYTKAIEINPNNLAAYSNRGVIYSKMYKFKLAIDDFSEIIKRDSKQVLVYMDRGVAYEALQDFPRAIQDYTKAVEISPQEIYGYVQRGTLYALLKEYDKAISDFTQVLHIIPNHPLAFYHRGMAYYDQQKYEQAIENFSSAISAKPNYTQAYLARADAYKKLQKYYLAINNYSLLLRASPNNVELLKLRGIAYADKKDHHHAIKDFTRGISISPSIFLYQSRAYSYMQQQQYEKALHDLQTAIQMDAKDSYSYYARGEINQKRGNNTQALEDFNTAIKLNSSDPMYFYSRALLYHDEKKHQQALQDLDTAISLKKDVSFYNHKGIVYEELLLDEKAIAEYNKALQLNPDFMYGYYNRGLVYNRTRKFDLAIADFNRAISTDKSYHEAYHARALAYKGLGQRNLALADLQQAISLKPHSGHYYNRGLIHEEEGDYRSAVADYKKSIALNAKYAKAYVRLANIYELHEKYRSAIRFWQKSHELQPDEGWEKNIALCRKAIQGSYQRKTYQTLQEAITAFYDQKSKWAGIYRIDSIEKLQIEWQKTMVVKVNVRYKYRLVKPLKSYKEQGFDQRFFIAKKINNRFAVIEMGDVNSAHFNQRTKMDEKIRNLWKNVIPQQQLDSNETKATYKSLSLADNITILNDEEIGTVIENNKHKVPGSGDASAASTIIENNTTQVPVNLHKSHHVILNEIARGGMGAIYHGNQMCLNRDVAIKKMLATNEETSLRFISEALVTAFLDHPNIVPIYELSKNESEEIILAMKLVGGHTWSEILESKDFSDHVEILLSVCNAIAYAHSKGIIHCDLKPANIMIGEFGEVLVMDWGIAVDISPNEVKRGIPQKEVQKPMGTPCYMPAELAEGRGEDIGPWTDVYLLGGILYKLLTGNPPHTGQTVLEVLRSACSGSELNFCDDTPLEIQEICRKALAFSPADRYQTALEFSNDLRNFTKHRESIIISNQANTKLTQCIANCATKNIYEELTTCISGFQQAIELWADNLQAKTRLYDARIFYAQTALENGDLGLAQVQTQKIQDSEQKQQLLAQVNLALHEKKSAQHRARMMKYALIASVITIVVIGITSYLKIVYEKSVAVKNAQIAEEQKYIAETQRESAERLRREKERDATNIRGHMAQISLHKASDIAQKNTLHDLQYSQIATYAGAAAKFIKNIDMNIAQQLRLPIHNIKQQVKSKISTALREHSLLWTTLGTHNIFHHKGARICWSSDGNLLATAHTHNIILWNAQGQNLRTWTTTDEVSDICFSQNNKHICAAVNKNIKIFDLYTTQRHTLSGHDAPITALKLYNESLVSACTNGEIHLWDFATGKNIQTIKYAQPITTLAPCSAVQKIVFTTQDNIGLIDVAQRSIIKVVGIDSAPITSLAFSPSGDFIACAAHDHVIKVWDGKLQGIHTNFAGHSAKINQLLFKNDQELLSVSDDKSIKAWNLTTKDHISLPHTQPVKGITVAHDLLCTIDDNGYATLWKNNQKVNSFPGHRDIPYNLIFRQNLLFVHNNKQINIYDEYSGQKIYELNTPVYGIDVSMDGSLLAIATEKEVDLWDTTNKRYVGKLHIGQDFDHKLIKFRPQHHTIAICVNNDIQLWSLQTQKMQAAIERSQGTASINFSRDGQKLITTSENLTVQIWNIHETQTTYNYTTKNSDGSLCLYEFDSEQRTDYAAFNATGNLVALSTDFGQIHIYQYTGNSWKMYTKIINNAQPYTMPVFHPQHNNMICANNVKGVYIFRLQANSPHIMQFIELSDIKYHCFAQHGNTLATATQRDVKLWQVKNSDAEFSGRGVTTSNNGRFIAWIQGVRSIVVYDTKTHKKWQVPENHLESITKLTFHPQSNVLVSADGENIIFLNEITDAKVEVKDTNMIGYHLTFNKDGSKAATLNMREELVHIWDAQNAKSLYDIEHDDFAYHAIFSDNGTLLATDNGSNIFIWDVDSGKQLATLSATVKDLVSFAGTTITYKNFQDELVDCDIETAKSTPRPEKIIFAYKDNIISLDNEVLYTNAQGKKHAIKKISGKIEYLCFAEQFIVVQKSSRIELIHLNKTKQVVFANNTSSGFVWNPDKQKWIFHVDEKNLLHAMEGFFAQKMMPSLSLRAFSPPLYLWNSEE